MINHMILTGSKHITVDFSSYLYRKEAFTILTDSDFKYRHIGGHMCPFSVCKENDIIFTWKTLAILLIVVTMDFEE